MLSYHLVTSARLAMGFWMNPNASVMILIILILMIQRVVAKALAKNVLIIMEIARDYKLLVFNVTSNG